MGAMEAQILPEKVTPDLFWLELDDETECLRGQGSGATHRYGAPQDLWRSVFSP